MESPLTSVVIGLGREQLQDDLVPFQRLTSVDKSWAILIEDQLFDMYNGSAVISIVVDNHVRIKLQL